MKFRFFSNMGITTSLNKMSQPAQRSIILFLKTDQIPYISNTKSQNQFTVLDRGQLLASCYTFIRTAGSSWGSCYPFSQQRPYFRQVATLKWSSCDPKMQLLPLHPPQQPRCYPPPLPNSIPINGNAEHINSLTFNQEI